MSLESTINSGGQSSINMRKATAILKAGEIGARIRKEIPEVAKYYSNTILFKSEICEVFNICKRYLINPNIAVYALGYAIAGFPGFGDMDAYPGLIKNKKELRRIGRTKQQRSGKESYEAGIKGLKSRGCNLWEGEEKVFDDNGNFVGIIPEELELTYMLSQLASYRNFENKIDAAKIGKELDRFYSRLSGIRRGRIVSSRLCKYRKENKLPK